MYILATAIFPLFSSSLWIDSEISLHSCLYSNSHHPKFYWNKNSWRFLSTKEIYFPRVLCFSSLTMNIPPFNNTVSQTCVHCARCSAKFFIIVLACLNWSDISLQQWRRTKLVLWGFLPGWWRRTRGGRASITRRDGVTRKINVCNNRHMNVNGIYELVPYTAFIPVARFFSLLLFVLLLASMFATVVVVVVVVATFS